MMTAEQIDEDYRRVERAIRFLEQEALRQPSLAEVAEAAGLSEFHFQRLFSRWVGISPKRFLQFLTKEYARSLLEESRDVLSVSYDSGLSSPGRLHELFVTCEAVTPGEVKSRGEGLSIEYGFHPSPFGRCLLAVTGRGICGLSFVQEDPEEHLVRSLRRRWPGASIREDADATAPMARQVFTFGADCEPGPLHLFVRGTNFQIQVWQALIRIPFGKAVTYEDVARHIGMPTASRAVGNAVGNNPIPFLIPCHRVIKKLGEFGNYGEGPQRKKAILGWEAALTHGETA
ncbi:MAG TPA: bifunctional helix-turn-helix domain-containing protein/methylated-DNA--[protein]-cysteine S-methyltransferase [Spirochaetia bacterium]|nr:bifunctional helix-turn-helix domain-containing protein/methylated-DNA--[protein]-cysteine S-methyltransferase [Spirochaetia bacterium]